MVSCVGSVQGAQRLRTTQREPWPQGHSGKISGFGSPNGLQNGVQNGSRNGSRAIPDPNTYKRRKHYYSNAKWLWVPLLIHRFSLNSSQNWFQNWSQNGSFFGTLVFSGFGGRKPFQDASKPLFNEFPKKVAPIWGPVLA